ncbi:MAG TPA: DUF2062 domain-containing protein [Steroidobacteraceae bacterium]|nr:DUF2062 domain-containing protein [Steroidobacteraceae bacterium]
MPRRLLRRITPHARALGGRWYLRAFGSHFTDPRLWTLQRRGITAAFGAGLAICFVPLPVHTPLAVLVAIVWRLNVVAVIATTWIVNPFTMVPIYYVAYRVGVAVTGDEPHAFGFRLSWDWLQHGLGPMWKPFLVGCLICSVLCGIAGWVGLEVLWRWRVISRRYLRRTASSPS